MWSRPVGRQRNVVASGCLLTAFNSSSPPGLRQYLEAINSKSKSKITLLILPALGHGQTGADQAPSTEVPVLLTRNPFPTIFGEDQSATPQPFWRFLHPPHSAVHKALGLFPLLHEPSPHRSLHTGSPGHEQTVGPTSTLLGQGNKNLVFRLPGQITAIF